MTITVKADQWDNSAWDALGTDLSAIQAGNTFTVQSIDQNNRVVTLTPQNIILRSWDDAAWDDQYTSLSQITVGQTFTVLSVDVNNRVVWFTG